MPLELSCTISAALFGPSTTLPRWDDGAARRHLSPLSPQHSIKQKMRLTASLFYLPLCAMMAAVRAGETETQCESPHQVASVAQAVTDACQDAAGSDGLPEHCTAECAEVFLSWFDDAQGTCFRALHLDEQTEQTFSAFATVCDGWEICFE
eukprot:SAG31_NODE_685_length_12832_cov_28.355376_2_plen_151_part_00